MRAVLVTFAQAAWALRVCLVVPGVPWQFGAYQRQQYLLSVGLDKLGHKISWMSMNHETAEYASAVKMPINVEQEYGHLTFLGRGPPQEFGGRLTMTPVSRLNELAKALDIQVFVTLMDANRIYRDTPPSVPTIAWLPYHFEAVSASDLYLLRGVTAVASLTPSMARTIATQVGSAALVRYVPHEVESGPEPVKPLEAAVKFPAGSFTALMQGGNYETADRKGWLGGILAFARFHAGVKDPLPKPHLYIHAISSVRIAEGERAAAPGAAAQPSLRAGVGVPLMRYLLASGLPSDAYTLDEEIHDTKHVAALKSAADVCLHASKTEGFGLNVLECQVWRHSARALSLSHAR